MVFRRTVSTIRSLAVPRGTGQSFRWLFTQYRRFVSDLPRIFSLAAKSLTEHKEIASSRDEVLRLFGLSDEAQAEALKKSLFQRAVVYFALSIVALLFIVALYWVDAIFTLISLILLLFSSFLYFVVHGVIFMWQVDLLSDKTRSNLGGWLFGGK